MTRSLRLLAAIAAGVAFPASASAQAARPCISPAESEAVVSYLLPPLVTGLAGTCASRIGERSYLVSQGPRLSERLRPAAHLAWPAARAAVQRVVKLPLPPEVIGDAAETTIGPVLAAGLAGQVDAPTCRTADRLLAALDPLPAGNLSEVMALFIELGTATNDKVPFRVCP